MPWCPFAARFPVRNHSGAMAAQLGLVLHVQQGDGSLRLFFDEPANKASAHWWVARSGALEQYIDSGLRSWAQVAGNSTYCSVETEGWGRVALTDAQVNTLAKLYRWGHDTHGWPLAVADTPGERGFGAHYMGGAAWGGHPCPLPTRAAQRPQILELAGGGIPAETGDDELTPDEKFMLRFGYVEAVYEWALGRPASTADVMNGVDALSKGMTPERFRDLVARSPEAKARAKKA